MRFVYLADPNAHIHENNSNKCTYFCFFCLRVCINVDVYTCTCMCPFLVESFLHISKLPFLSSSFQPSFTPTLPPSILSSYHPSLPSSLLSFLPPSLHSPSYPPILPLSILPSYPPILPPSILLSLPPFFLSFPTSSSPSGQQTDAECHHLIPEVFAVASLLDALCSLSVWASGLESRSGNLRIHLKKRTGKRGRDMGGREGGREGLSE